MSVTQQDVKEGRINDQLENQLDSISAQVEAGWEEGKNRLADWRQAANEKTRQMTDSVKTMARENPWQFVAGAAAVGVVLALLFARRR